MEKAIYFKVPSEFKKQVMEYTLHNKAKDIKPNTMTELFIISVEEYMSNNPINHTQ